MRRSTTSFLADRAGRKRLPKKDAVWAGAALKARMALYALAASASARSVQRDLHSSGERDDAFGFGRCVTVGHVPEEHGRIVAGGDERLAVSREDEGVGFAAVASKCAQLLAGLHVPEADCVVIAGRRQRPAIRCEGDAARRFRMAGEEKTLLVRWRLPRREWSSDSDSWPTCGRRAKRRLAAQPKPATAIQREHDFLRKGLCIP